MSMLKYLSYEIVIPYFIWRPAVIAVGLFAALWIYENFLEDETAMSSNTYAFVLGAASFLMVVAGKVLH